MESLTVIAVIAVLAGLLFPALGKAKAEADNVSCVSNLRQMGCAITSYSIDNNNYLPGPLFTGQAAFYTTNEGTLPALLQKYMNLTPIQQWPTSPNAFICPAFRRVIAAGSTPMYAAESIYSNGYTIMRPWGYPAGGVWTYPPLAPGVVSLPVKTMAQLASAIDPTTGGRVSLSKAVAIHDTDQTEKQYLSAPIPPSWLSTLPKTPVHGDHQNALFFDWHVGRINSVTQAPL